MEAGDGLALPCELQSVIFSFLDESKDLCLIQEVCKPWRQIAVSPSFDASLWRTVCVRVFGLSPLVSHSLPSWREFWRVRSFESGVPFKPDYQVNFFFDLFIFSVYL